MKIRLPLWIPCIQERRAYFCLTGLTAGPPITENAVDENAIVF